MDEPALDNFRSRDAPGAGLFGFNGINIGPGDGEGEGEIMEREEEQSDVKINDRRKFNVDGSLREGVEITPEKPKEEVKTAPPAEAKTVEQPAETASAEELDNGLPGRWAAHQRECKDRIQLIFELVGKEGV